MNRQLVFLCAGVFALMPIVSGQTPGPSSAHAQRLGGPPTARFHAASVQSVDIPALRTRTSTTSLHQGVDTTRLYPGSVHYRDAHGVWQPIDNRLIPMVSAQGRAGYRNRANAYRVVFPRSLATDPVRISTDHAWIAVGLRGAAGTGQVTGSSIAYRQPGAIITDTA